MISIHALHEESDYFITRNVNSGVISIHALHEESDGGWPAFHSIQFVISIHALHEESDLDNAT